MCGSRFVEPRSPCKVLIKLPFFLDFGIAAVFGFGFESWGVDRPPSSDHAGELAPISLISILPAVGTCQDENSHEAARTEGSGFQVSAWLTDRDAPPLQPCQACWKPDGYKIRPLRTFGPSLWTGRTTTSPNSSESAVPRTPSAGSHPYSTWSYLSS